MVIAKNYGRMGNSFFQNATAIGYAKKHGLDFTVPSTTNDKFWNPLHLQHLVNRDYNPTLPKIELKEEGHQYQELPFEEEWRDKNIVLDGYWQSEKYFKHCREDILRLFGIWWGLNEGVVSIHVRRGDYVKYADKHPPVTIEYISKAIDYFMQMGYDRYFVFSDDIRWCWDNINERVFPNAHFEYSSGRSDGEDLKLMSCCEHNIIANSSFSWWAAWLNQNENKIVIVPEVWFGNGNSHLQTQDIYCEGWIKM